MAWLPVYQTMPTNRKTLRLKKLLKTKTPQVVGHLCLLWLWALDNAPDGDLSAFTADEVAEVAEWSGKDPSVFVQALIESGYVDDNMCLHDWDDYAGKLIEKRDVKREQNRIRQQRRRDKLNTERDGHGDVTRDSRVSCPQYSTLQYSTLQYSRVEEEKEEEKESGTPTLREAKIVPADKPVKHKHGEYGWVKLTDAEYDRMCAELGADKADAAIAYVDESAQRTGNKNGWKDWNLVVRKAIRDNWGGISGKAARASPLKNSNVFLDMLEEEYGDGSGRNA